VDRLDALTRELAEIQDRLLALPDDAFAARYALRRRQDELRAEAARHRVDRDASRPTAELLAELAALRARLRDIERDHIDLVQQAGSAPQSAGPGAAGWGAPALNAAMDRTRGVEAIRARIGRLMGVLVDRGTDPDGR